MGLLDFFSNKDGGLGKHAARVANKRAQNPDRWESIRALGAMKSEEAVSALLKRFTFRVDPSITDHEEKDLALQYILEAGDTALGPVKAFLRTADAISWPVKILERLEGEPRVVAQLIELLADMDTEYERDPERKLQVLAYLEDQQHGDIAAAVARFFGDVNETARFHAVGAACHQEDASGTEKALVEALVSEESLRVRARLFELAAKLGTELPEETAKALSGKLADGYRLNGRVIIK